MLTGRQGEVGLVRIGVSVRDRVRSRRAFGHVFVEQCMYISLTPF